MDRLEKILHHIEFITRILYVMGALAICALFLLMFGDVLGRFLFNAPIRGTTEVSEYLLVAITFLSLGYAQLKGSHIVVDTFVSRFPVNIRLIVNILLTFLALLFFAIMTWKISERAYLDWADNILLSRTTVRLPVWWKSFIAALGCALLVVSLGVQIIRDIFKVICLSENGRGDK